MEFHDINWITMAAWVQAIGSIIAIGIAIWVPFRLAKDSQNKQEAEKVSLSRVIQVFCHQICIDCVHLLKIFWIFNRGKSLFLVWTGVLKILMTIFLV